ncbi:hypothetical protein MMPV_001748 [Pyropia vietnamensis]
MGHLDTDAAGAAAAAGNGRGATAAAAGGGPSSAVAATPGRERSSLWGSRYELRGIMGKGGYGCVMSAIDVRTNRPVAIKRVDAVFQSLPMVLRILREVKFNRRLAGHPNLVALRDVVWPRDASFKDVRMVFDSMPCDLDRFIESRRGAGIDEQLIKLLMLQLLQGLAYLHEARVMHRDLKPANVLIDETCRLKICDLGLARANFETHNGDHAHLWTAHVVSRCYRAPELIVPHTTDKGFVAGVPYSSAIDVWAAGCVFAELFLCVPLFGGATCQAKLLELIFDLLGTPPYDVAQRMFPPELLAHMLRRPTRPKYGLDRLMPAAPPAAVALMSAMLTFDPRTRITAAAAVASPYFDDVRAEVEELGRPSAPPPPTEGESGRAAAAVAVAGATTGPIRPPVLQAADFDFEVRVASGLVNEAEVLRDELLAEIAYFHPEHRSTREADILLGMADAEARLREAEQARVQGGSHNPYPQGAGRQAVSGYPRASQGGLNERNNQQLPPWLSMQPR